MKNKSIFFMFLVFLFMASWPLNVLAGVEEEVIKGKDVKVFSFILADVQFSYYPPDIIIAKNNVTQHIFIELESIQDNDQVIPLAKFELGKANSGVQIGNYGRPLQTIVLGEGVKIARIQVTISLYSEHWQERGAGVVKGIADMMRKNKQKQTAEKFIAKKIFIFK